MRNGFAESSSVLFVGSNFTSRISMEFSIARLLLLIVGRELTWSLASYRKVQEAYVR